MASKVLVTLGYCYGLALPVLLCPDTLAEHVICLRHTAALAEAFSLCTDHIITQALCLFTFCFDHLLLLFVLSSCSLPATICLSHQWILRRSICRRTKMDHCTAITETKVKKLLPHAMLSWVMTTLRSVIHVWNKQWA